MFRLLHGAISNRLAVFSPDEYRFIIPLGCSFLYFCLAKPEIGSLMLAVTLLTLLIQLGSKVLNVPRKLNIPIATGATLSFLLVLGNALPAHAILEGVEQAIKDILATEIVDDAELEQGITNFFTILDLFIVFVLIGSVVFAIYQGSQSNDIRPILFVIAFIVGGIMVLEIGSRLILGADDATGGTTTPIP